MSEAELQALFARWRAEPDAQARSDVLAEIVRQPHDDSCATALKLLLEDGDLLPDQFAELGWIVRKLGCWRTDATIAARIARSISDAMDPEALLAVMEIAYESGTPEGLAILEERAAHTSLAGELRGFAIERIGLVGHASDATTETIRRGLRDPDPSIRFWSCYSLASLGDSGDLPIVEALLLIRPGLTHLEPLLSKRQ